MVSIAMSKIAAARGRGVDVMGRKGGRWRHRRTVVERSGEKSFVQSDWSSMRMRRVMRLRWP